MIDLIGEKFSRLTIISRAANDKHGQTKYLCRCDCGNYSVIDKYRLTHNRVKSCGCYKREITSLTHALRPYEATYNLFRSIAQQENHSCELTYEDYLKFTRISKCHYCSSAIPWHPKISGKKSAYYLDRKDNNLGYTLDNCVVCCSRCNWAKGSKFPYQEWIAVGKAIQKFREETNGQSG
jgi:5-methylcytosine-specific restriction endonuclease McrA